MDEKMTNDEMKNVLALSRASLNHSIDVSQSQDEQKIFGNIDKILHVAELLLSECERLKDFIKENYPSDHFDLVIRVKKLEEQNEKLRMVDTRHGVKLVDRLGMAENKVKELERELKLAILHDRQPYPTADAYEKVCKALHAKEKRIEELGSERDSETRWAKQYFEQLEQSQKRVKKLEEGIRTFDNEAYEEHCMSKATSKSLKGRIELWHKSFWNRRGKMRVIDPKFHIEGEQIIKTSNGEPIPDDEPLILVRARDNLAVALLKAYLHLSVKANCTDYQILGVAERISAFERFANNNPKRMKSPGITEGR